MMSANRNKSAIVRLLQRCVVAEDRLGRKIWEFILVMALLYMGIVFPLRLAFVHFRLRECDADGICEECRDPPQESSFFEILDVMMSVFFWIDLFLNFFLTFRNKDGIEIFDIEVIAVKYLQGFFLINLLACLPGAAFVPIMGSLPVDPGGCSGGANSAMTNQATRLLRLQRMTRLARLARLVRLVRLAQLAKKAAQALNVLRSFRMINLVVLLFWIVHLLACGLYLTAAMHEQHWQTWVGRRSMGDGRSLLFASPFMQWSNAMYFILTVFTTVGFGDMSAVTLGEIWYMVLVMLVGTIVHSIVIGEVINLVNEVDQETVLKRQRLALIEEFSSHTLLHEDTKEQLLDFIKGLRSKGGTYDRQEMRRFMTGVAWPRKLLGEIPDQLFSGMMLRNKFVQICSISCTDSLPPRFALLLSTMLSSQSFKANETIYKRHDHAFLIFFVLSGTFSYVDDAVRKDNEGDAPVTSHGNSDIPVTTRSNASVNAAEITRSFTMCTASDSEKSKALSDRDWKRLAWRPSGMSTEPPPQVNTLNVEERSKSYSSRSTGAPTSSRIDGPTAWTAVESDIKPWVKMDLGTRKAVCGVLLQGHPSREEWVTELRVSVSLTSPQGPWERLGTVFSGCTQHKQDSEIHFAVVKARFVRLEAAKWSGRCSLRAALFVMDPQLHPYQLFGKFNFFGDEALLGTNRRTTSRCEVRGEVLTLHKSSLFDASKGMALLHEFPQFRDILRAAVVNREASRRRLQASLRVGRTCECLAVATVQAFWRRVRVEDLPRSHLMRSQYVPESVRSPIPGEWAIRDSMDILAAKAQSKKSVMNTVAKPGQVADADFQATVIRLIESRFGELRSEVQQVRSELRAMSEQRAGQLLPGQHPDR